MGLGLERSCSEEERIGSTAGDKDGEGEKSALPQPQSGQAASEMGKVPPSLIWHPSFMYSLPIESYGLASCK